MYSQERPTERVNRVPNSKGPRMLSYAGKDVGREATGYSCPVEGML